MQKKQSVIIARLEAARARGQQPWAAGTGQAFRADASPNPSPMWLLPVAAVPNSVMFSRRSKVLR